MLSPSDSLVYALTDIAYGLFFLSIAGSGVRRVAKLALLVIFALLLLAHEGVYLNTGWHWLGTGSRVTMVVMIVAAMWRYATRVLAVEEDEEEAGRESAGR